MKRLEIVSAMLSLFVLAASPAAAGAGYQGGMGDQMERSPHGMMKQSGACMEMMGYAPNGMQMLQGDLTAGPMREMHGMMMGGAAPSFYLDMREKLGLDPRQVDQLRDIRRNFRKELVRRAAEMKIAKMELEDAFAREWTVEGVEQQLSNIQQLRTDLVVRYLKARKKAEGVLSGEQLQMVQGMMEP